MDNPHFSRLGAKRPRLQENDTVLTTSVSTFQSYSDAVGALWKSEYEKISQEKLDLKVNHIQLQSKYEELVDKFDDSEQKNIDLQEENEKLQNKADDLQQKNEKLNQKNLELQEKHEALEEAHQSLQLLSNNQSSRLSQLPTEIEVSRLNEAMARMECEAKRHLRQVADLEKARETDKVKIAEVEKAQEDARQAFEKEKKDLRERIEQHIKVLKENHQNEITFLRQNIDRMNVKNKDRDQVTEDMKKQHEEDKAKLAEIEKKVEKVRKAHEKEKKILVTKQVADQRAYEEDKKKLLSKIAEMERGVVVSSSNVHSDRAITSIAHSETVSSTANQCAIGKSTNANDDQLVIKKLFHVYGGAEWQAYLTRDENEKPTDLCLNGSNLFIDDEIVSKKLVIDGILTQFKDDPFESCIHNFSGTYFKFVSRLLKEFVYSCKLTDLFLKNLQLSWLDYEKLVSDGNVKNLYLSHVSVKSENGTIALLEEVMEMLPHIQRLGCVFRSSGSIKLTKQTFTKLPTFKNLHKFCLYGIVFGSFDADSFIAFMKKHPNAQFTLVFRFHELSVNEKAEVKTIAEKLRKKFPLSSKLEIHLMSSRSKFAIEM